MFLKRKGLISIVLFVTICLLLITMDTSYAAIATKPSKTIKPVPSIIVIDPTSSTAWTNHEYHTVLWKSAWVTGNVRLEVWKDGVFHSILANSTSVGEDGTGSYKAYIGEKYYRSGKYQIKVISLANENVFGISPMFFINEKVF